MKRLIVSLAATTLMGAGLVGVSAETASAACPYTGCVDTHTKVSASDVKQGQRATVCVKVTTGGNGQPKGRVGVVVVKKNHGYRFTDSKKYDGGRTCFKTDKLRGPGKYLVRANFEGKGAFNDSDGSTTFKVKKKKH